MKSEIKRTARRSFRMRPHEQRMLEEAAAAARVTPSELIRAAVRERAREVLADRDRELGQDQ